LEEQNFSLTPRNPLTELSELRFEIEPVEDEFDLKCRLKFGTMHYEYREREYIVGVSKAHLRLVLEGCETTFADVFGEQALAEISVDDSVQIQSALKGNVALNANTVTGASGEVDIGIGGSVVRTKNAKTQQKLLPVVAGPNDTWKIAPKTIFNKPEKFVEGSAIPSVRLCTIRRKQGGNRMSVLGEVHVSRSSIKVAANDGNRMGKSLSEWQNKNALVGLLLKKAIQREARSGGKSNSANAVCISRCEVVEK